MMSFPLYICSHYPNLALYMLIFLLLVLFQYSISTAAGVLSASTCSCGAKMYAMMSGQLGVRIGPDLQNISGFIIRLS